jgi:hypothetical protein
LYTTGWKLERDRLEIGRFLKNDRLEVRRDRLEIGRFLIHDRLKVRRDRLEILRFLINDRLEVKRFFVCTPCYHARIRKTAMRPADGLEELTVD